MVRTSTGIVITIRRISSFRDQLEVLGANSIAVIVPTLEIQAAAERILFGATYEAGPVHMLRAGRL